ncbi:hypothetical protein B0H13DRAFT_1023626 [Mycena leptocephala]|nr:hypothetical protein B0H13DRAFT_1023626 [Mycena leptocephala]
MTWFTHMFTHEGQDVSEAEAYEMVTNPEHPKHHEAKLSHELLAAAASFAAAKAYEDKVKVEHGGVPPDHALAKEILAGLAGAFIDRMVETEGLDALDEHERQKAEEEREQREEIKRKAKEAAQAHLAHKTKKYGALKMDGYGEVYGAVPMNGMM